MNLKITRVEVWTTDIDDKPGAVARTLRAIADYGADLDYVTARRDPQRPGKGRLLVSPLHGQEQIGNADQVGLRLASDLPTLRLEGTDSPGAGAKLAKTIADAGVNLNELSAAVYGHQFVCYATFDSAADLATAETALRALITTPHWQFWRRRSEPKAA